MLLHCYGIALFIINFIIIKSNYFKNFIISLFLAAGSQVARLVSNKPSLRNYDDVVCWVPIGNEFLHSSAAKSTRSAGAFPDRTRSLPATSPAPSSCGTSSWTLPGSWASIGSQFRSSRLIRSDLTSSLSAAASGSFSSQTFQVRRSSGLFSGSRKCSSIFLRWR